MSSSARPGRVLQNIVDDRDPALPLGPKLGIMVYSLLWVMQNLYRQPYGGLNAQNRGFWGVGLKLGAIDRGSTRALHRVDIYLGVCYGFEVKGGQKWVF